jgi:GNAT superfamily N-acetyltransferase
MVRLAAESDARQLGVSFTRAYEHDPFWRWLVPDDDYSGRTNIFFSAAIRHGILVDQMTYTTDDAVSAAVWTPPLHHEATQAQVDVLMAAFRECFGTNFDRFERTFGLMEEHHPRVEHWYLAGIATHPDWQGQGIASSLIRPIVERCDTERLPAYLEATKAANVGFYQRHGFALTSTFEGHGGPPLYLMWREPKRA